MTTLEDITPYLPGATEQPEGRLSATLMALLRGITAELVGGMPAEISLAGLAGMRDEGFKALTEENNALVPWMMQTLVKERSRGRFTVERMPRYYFATLRNDPAHYMALIDHVSDERRLFSISADMEGPGLVWHSERTGEELERAKRAEANLLQRHVNLQQAVQQTETLMDLISRKVQAFVAQNRPTEEQAEELAVNLGPRSFDQMGLRDLAYVCQVLGTTLAEVIGLGE